MPLGSVCRAADVAKAGHISCCSLILAQAVDGARPTFAAVGVEHT